MTVPVLTIWLSFCFVAITKWSFWTRHSCPGGGGLKIYLGHGTCPPNPLTNPATCSYKVSCMKGDSPGPNHLVIVLSLWTYHFCPSFLLLFFFVPFFFCVGGVVWLYRCSHFYLLESCFENYTILYKITQWVDLRSSSYFHWISIVSLSCPFPLCKVNGLGWCWHDQSYFTCILCLFGLMICLCSKDVLRTQRIVRAIIVLLPPFWKWNYLVCFLDMDISSDLGIAY